MAKGNSQKQANGYALEFEAQLWAAADKRRGHMDASESRKFTALCDALLLKLLSVELRAPLRKSDKEEVYA